MQANIIKFKAFASFSGNGIANSYFNDAKTSAIDKNELYKANIPKSEGENKRVIIGIEIRVMP